MSGFGLFLLMFAALCGLVALIRLLAWFTDVIEAGGPRAYFSGAASRYVVKTSADEPASIMSRSEPAAPVRQWLEPAEPIAVRPDTHQPEPVEPAENEPVREPSGLYRLSRREEIVMLAIQRAEDGSYRHSANDITKFIGGTAADVKDVIREVREGPAPKAEPPQPSKTLQRPANGWN